HVGAVHVVIGLAKPAVLIGFTMGFPRWYSLLLALHPGERLRLLVPSWRCNHGWRSSGGRSVARFSLIDMRAQARVLSALRSDTSPSAVPAAERPSPLA